MVNKMYSWRGYGDDHRLNPDPNRITLTATEQGALVGTMSVRVDSAESPLAADHVFEDHLNSMRARGATLCEMSKLAVDSSVRCNFTLARLFHSGLLYARDLHACTDIIVEINPRHRGFYKRMMGFTQLGETRTNPTVNAPACLMHITVDYVSMQVLQQGGSAVSSSGSCQSFYQYFGSPAEEHDMLIELKSPSV